MPLALKKANVGDNSELLLWMCEGDKHSSYITWRPGI